eukprot:gb/GFBE01041306.1/.p1 GENE.gb/GFBE01041306.1/~~gb/GFBE01041306.1/.p1  ORF type:complete len:119 (+),score=20.98 gb/GFBE01041306.1/:1-357(+)
MPLALGSLPIAMSTPDGVVDRRRLHGGSRCGRSVDSETAVDILLALGSAPQLQEVREVLVPVIGEWNSSPKKATVALAALAKRRLADVAMHVLMCRLSDLCLCKSRRLAAGTGTPWAA